MNNKKYNFLITLNHLEHYNIAEGYAFRTPEEGTLEDMQKGLELVQEALAKNEIGNVTMWCNNTLVTVPQKLAEQCVIAHEIVEITD